MSNHLRDVVNRALQREVHERIEAGERLFEGEWMQAQAWRRNVAKRALRRLWETFEAVIFWGILMAGAAILFLLITVII